MPDLVSQTQAVVARDGAIARIIGGAARISRGLRGERRRRRRGGARLRRRGHRQRSPRTRGELGESIDLLRPFEDEFLRTAPLADRSLDLTRPSTSSVRRPTALGEGAARGQQLLALGDTFRTETIRITEAINPVLAAAAPVLDDLRPTVASIKPLLGPLGDARRRRRPVREDIRLAGAGLVSATHAGPRRRDRAGQRRAAVRARPHLPQGARSVPRSRRDPGALGAVLRGAARQRAAAQARSSAVITILVGAIVIIVAGPGRSRSATGRRLRRVRQRQRPRLDRPRHPRRRRQLGQHRRGRADRRQRAGRARHRPRRRRPRRRPGRAAPAHAVRGQRVRRSPPGQPERAR